MSHRTAILQHRFERPRLHHSKPNVELVHDDELADAIRRIYVDKLLARYGPAQLRIAHERVSADAARHDVAGLTNADEGNGFDYVETR